MPLEHDDTYTWPENWADKTIDSENNTREISPRTKAIIDEISKGICKSFLEWNENYRTLVRSRQSPEDRERLSKEIEKGFFLLLDELPIKKGKAAREKYEFLRSRNRTIEDAVQICMDAIKDGTLLEK